MHCNIYIYILFIILGYVKLWAWNQHIIRTVGYAYGPVACMSKLTVSK